MIVGALVSRIERGSGYASIDIAQILSELKAKEALPVLVTMLDLKPLFTTLNTRPIVYAVVAFGTPAIPYLEKALNEGRLENRQEACIALGFIGGRKARAVLESLLTTEAGRDVIEYAKSALSEIAASDARTHSLLRRERR